MRVHAIKENEFSVLRWRSEKPIKCSIVESAKNIVKSGNMIFHVRTLHMQLLYQQGSASIALFPVHFSFPLSYWIIFHLHSLACFDAIQKCLCAEITNHFPWKQNKFARCIKILVYFHDHDTKSTPNCICTLIWAASHNFLISTPKCSH